MRKTLVRGTIIAVVFGLLADPPVGSAPRAIQPMRAPLNQLSLNAWVANFSTRHANYALRNYTAKIEELSIFGVGGNRNGGLAAERDFIADALAAARSQTPAPRVLLTIANARNREMGDRKLLTEWLGSPESRRRHIQDLLLIAQPMDGLDIDYENLRPKDGPAYAAFIVELGKALHKRGKYLTITVEPNLMLYGSMDWKSLSQVVDRIRIMAYPFHFERTPPGPVSPPATVKYLVTRTLEKVALNKIEIALPVYGFDWSKGNGKLVATTQQFDQLAALPGARVFRDAKTRCARIDYSVTEMENRKRVTVQHEVWFEDPASVNYKIQMLKRMGIVQIGLWQLGVGEISELFKLVRPAPQQPKVVIQKKKTPVPAKAKASSTKTKPTGTPKLDVFHQLP